jgi:hypothetical protein
MTRIDIDTFKSIDNENTGALLDDQGSDSSVVKSHKGDHGLSTREIVQTSLAEALKQHDASAVIMVELPTDTYFAVNAASLKFLISRGFQGVYLSFQRPFSNVASLFSEYGIDDGKLLVIDGATSLSGEPQGQHKGCVYFSAAADIDALTQMIYVALQGLKGKKKFVFIDSLTTLALYRSFDETIKFAHVLAKIIRRKEFAHGTLLFNVAADLSEQGVVQDVACFVDQVINVADAVEQYVDNVIDAGLYT